MSTDLEELKKQGETGNLKAARDALMALTTEDPLNKNAWELLASISEDPYIRAECYRHLLQIDPGDRQAATRLLEVSAQIQSASPLEKPIHEFDPILYCKRCGGSAEVHFVGDLHDKRAICSYCGTEVDLPDSYSRIQKLREHRTLPGGSEQPIEKTVVETRHDGTSDTGAFENYPPELQKIIQTLKEKGPEAFTQEHLKGPKEYRIKEKSDPGGTEAEDLQASQEQDIEPSEESPDSQAIQTGTETIKEKNRSIFTLPFFKRKTGDRKRRSLSIEELVLLSGDPLPPEERRNCPNPRCEAVISKSVTQCPWCGEQL